MHQSSTSHTVLRVAAVLGTAGMLAALAAPGCLIDWADDCGHDLGSPGCIGGVGTGAGASTSSSSTGMTGGGGGGMTGCVDASTCPAPPAGPCASLGTPACVGGKCTVTYTAGPAPSQQYGSCTQNVCDATGNESTVEDDTNVFDDGNQCTADTCVGGAPLNMPTLGASCELSMTGTGVCEIDPDPSNHGLYTCAGCDPSLATSCAGDPGSVCIQGSCLPTHCRDKVTDDGETDVDCGGSVCLPCASNKMCNASTDCFSQVCMGGTCLAPTCSDGIQNQDETDIDCGGSACPPCRNTKKCLLPTDCQSGVCEPTSPDAGPLTPDRCQAPTCTDGVKNGDETGIDCGNDGGDAGPVCPPCAAM